MKKILSTLTDLGFLTSSLFTPRYAWSGQRIGVLCISRIALLALCTPRGVAELIRLYRSNPSRSVDPRRMADRGEIMRKHLSTQLIKVTVIKDAVTST